MAVRHKKSFSVVSAAAVLASFTARNPAVLGAEPITLQASADTGELIPPVDTIQAMAVTGFQSVSGKLQWVKATEHFYATAGVIIKADDYVQLEESDAKRLVAAGRAVLATDEEVAAAQKPKTAKASA